MQKIASYNGKLMSLVLLEENLASVDLKVWLCSCGFKCTTLYYGAFHCEKYHKGENFKDRMKLKEDFPTDTKLWNLYYTTVSDILVQSIESRTKTKLENTYFSESRVKKEPVDEDEVQQGESTDSLRDTVEADKSEVADQSPRTVEKKTPHEIPRQITVEAESCKVADQNLGTVANMVPAETPLDGELSDDNKTSEEGVFVVQEIVGIKAFVKEKMIKYKIRWQGYDADGDTWEPSETLSEPLVAKMIEVYREANKNKVAKEEAKLNDNVRPPAKCQRRKTWDIVELIEEPNRSDLTKPRELDKSDEFYGEIAGKMKGEAKQLFDPTHKNTPTELLLSILPTNERVTRRQMKQLLPGAASSSGSRNYADLASGSRSPTPSPKPRRKRVKKEPTASPCQNPKSVQANPENLNSATQKGSLDTNVSDRLDETVESVDAKRHKPNSNDVSANTEEATPVRCTAEILTSGQEHEPILEEAPTETNSSGGTTPNIPSPGAPALPLIIRPEVASPIPDPATFPYPYFGYLYDYNVLFNPDNSPTVFHWQIRGEYYKHIKQQNLDPLTARSMWMQQSAKNHIL